MWVISWVKYRFGLLETFGLMIAYILLKESQVQILLTIHDRIIELCNRYDTFDIVVCIYMEIVTI